MISFPFFAFINPDVFVLNRHVGVNHAPNFPSLACKQF